RHAGRPPMPGEAVHAEHLLSALRITLDQTPPPRHPLVWQFDFVDDGTYTLRSGDGGWVLVHGVDRDATPDVVVTTDTGAWTRFQMTPPEQRAARLAGVDLSGSTRDIECFLQLLAPFPYSVSTAQPSPP
ncbi:MAG: hypothetical protein ACRDPR_07005, partial [Nocardioidaceae bacterium]